MILFCIVAQNKFFSCFYQFLNDFILRGRLWGGPEDGMCHCFKISFGMSSRNRLSIGRILILGSRVTSQCCSAHAHIWRCCLLSSPGFLTSPYMERAPGHVTAAQSRDLASPIYGHVGALTGYTWPRDLSRDLISLGPDTGVCNGCNVCPITHA